MEYKNRNKFSFTFHHGMYFFVQMQFSMKILPERLQRTINAILACKMARFCGQLEQYFHLFQDAQDACRQCKLNTRILVSS